MGEGEGEREAGRLDEVGRGLGVDSAGGLGLPVGFPGFGLPGLEHDPTVLVSVTVSVTVTYETIGEELGWLGTRTGGDELGPFGIETGGEELGPPETVGEG